MRLRGSLLLVICVGTLSVAPLLDANAATAPRLAGSYHTTLTITYLHGWAHAGVYVGEHAIKTWTFVPQCASGGCTTLLSRPSIAKASTLVYAYTLKAVSAREYRGTSKPTPNSCILSSGQEIPNAYVQTQRLDLHVTKVSRGRVVSYTGTNITTVTPNATGRAHGCVVATQRATFKA